MLTELDGAELDGAYAGNRVKKYCLRSTQKEVAKDPDEPEEPDKPDEPDKPGDGGRKKWPLPGCGFFVQIP